MLQLPLLWTFVLNSSYLLLISKILQYGLADLKQLPTFNIRILMADPKRVYYVMLQLPLLLFALAAATYFKYPNTYG